MFGKKPLAKKIETATGVDIGAFAVKIVQITKKPEGFYLDGLGYAKIDPYRTNGVNEAIQTAINESKISFRKVVSSIPAEGSILA